MAMKIIKRKLVHIRLLLVFTVNIRNIKFAANCRGRGHRWVKHNDRRIVLTIFIFDMTLKTRVLSKGTQFSPIGTIVVLYSIKGIRSDLLQTLTSTW